MSLVKWRVSTFASKPERLEYEKETAHYLVKSSGQGRDAKRSSYYSHFDSETEALRVIELREQAAAARKREMRVSKHAMELLSALELVTDCLTKALTGGEVPAGQAGRALTMAAEAMAKAKG